MRSRANSKEKKKKKEILSWSLGCCNASCQQSCCTSRVLFARWRFQSLLSPLKNNGDTLEATATLHCFLIWKAAMKRLFTANTSPWHEAALLPRTLAWTAGERTDLISSYSKRAPEDRQGSKDFITVTSLGALPGWKGGQPLEMAENAPSVFGKQTAVTQKLGTDCCLHVPSWASWPRHRTRRSYTVSYLLTLVPICYCGRMPGHELLQPQVPRNDGFPRAVSTTMKTPNYFLQEPLCCSRSEDKRCAALVLYWGDAPLTLSPHRIQVFKSDRLETHLIPHSAVGCPWTYLLEIWFSLSASVVCGHLVGWIGRDKGKADHFLLKTGILANKIIVSFWSECCIFEGLQCKKLFSDQKKQYFVSFQKWLL